MNEIVDTEEIEDDLDWYSDKEYDEAADRNASCLKCGTQWYKRWLKSDGQIIAYGCDNPECPNHIGWC